MRGSYEVEVTIHSYRNPEGRRCGLISNCYQTTLVPPGCCDEDTIRPRNQSCQINRNTCDTGIAYCVLPLGSTQPCPFMEMVNSDFEVNTNIFTDIGNMFLGINNPIEIQSSVPWRVSQWISLSN